MLTVGCAVMVSSRDRSTLEVVVALVGVALTPTVRAVIASAVATSTHPGRLSILGELSGTVLEVPVPELLTVDDHVLAVATPGDRFTILVRGLCDVGTSVATSIVAELCAAAHRQDCNAAAFATTSRDGAAAGCRELEWISQH
jgi:hypothetical protein